MDDELLFYVNGKRVIGTEVKNFIYLLIVVHWIFFVHSNQSDKNVDPEETLLYYLRNKLHLTGTKLGCGEGGCGACTVMVSAFESGKVVHRAVNACLAPICSMHHCAVTTVEGIGSTQSRLHQVQQALVENHGSQCGFCTPGIVMSMYTLIRNVRKPTEHMIERALQGNLCRCTGYRPILQGFSLFSPDDGKDGGKQSVSNNGSSAFELWATMRPSQTKQTLKTFIQPSAQLKVRVNFKHEFNTV